jgi:hypothetical protein
MFSHNGQPDRGRNEGVYAPEWEPVVWVVLGEGIIKTISLKQEVKSPDETA